MVFGLLMIFVGGILLGILIGNSLKNYAIRRNGRTKRD